MNSLLLVIALAIPGHAAPRCPTGTVLLHIDHARKELTCAIIAELTREQLAQVTPEAEAELSAEDAAALAARRAKLSQLPSSPPKTCVAIWGAGYTATCTLGAVTVCKPLLLASPYVGVACGIVGGIVCARQSVRQAREDCSAEASN